MFPQVPSGFVSCFTTNAELLRCFVCALFWLSLGCVQWSVSLDWLSTTYRHAKHNRFEQPTLIFVHKGTCPFLYNFRLLNPKAKSLVRQPLHKLSSNCHWNTCSRLHSMVLSVYLSFTYIITKQRAILIKPQSHLSACFCTELSSLMLHFLKPFKLTEPFSAGLLYSLLSKENMFRQVILTKRFFIYIHRNTAVLFQFILL